MLIEEDVGNRNQVAGLGEVADIHDLALSSDSQESIGCQACFGEPDNHLWVQGSNVSDHSRVGRIWKKDRDGRGVDQSRLQDMTKDSQGSYRG